jgi:hypothetical protein
VYELLYRLAATRKSVFIIDVSEVGNGCKGHLPEHIHLQLLGQRQDLLPSKAQAIFLGDGEFDRIELQAALQTTGFLYVCRTAKNTQLYEDDLPFSFSDLILQPDDLIFVPDVWFTREGYGQVTVIAWWRRGYLGPIFLVTSFDLPDEACCWYKKRFHIAAFFANQKSCGFYLHKSHLADPTRLATLMIAACLAYLWIRFLGLSTLREGWGKLIHRTDRR